MLCEGCVVFFMKNSHIILCAKHLTKKIHYAQHINNHNNNISIFQNKNMIQISSFY